MNTLENVWKTITPLPVNVWILVLRPGLLPEDRKPHCIAASSPRNGRIAWTQETRPQQGSPWRCRCPASTCPTVPTRPDGLETPACCLAFRQATGMFYRSCWFFFCPCFEVEAARTLCASDDRESRPDATRRLVQREPGDIFFGFNQGFGSSESSDPLYGQELVLPRASPPRHPPTPGASIRRFQRLRKVASQKNQMGVRAEAESRKVSSSISRCPAH